MNYCIKCGHPYISTSISFGKCNVCRLTDFQEIHDLVLHSFDTMIDSYKEDNKYERVEDYLL